VRYPFLIRLCIAYPADPLGDVAGGIDAFIRGAIRYAPSAFEIKVVGATTDPEIRPVGKWIKGRLGDKSFDFFPVVKLNPSGRRSLIPVSLRYTFALLFNRRATEADVLEFHELEPCIAFLFDSRPKNVFIHTNMNVLHDRNSSIRWRHFPWLYFWLERKLIRRVNTIFCVRSDAVEEYRRRYPQLAQRFRFTPNWVGNEFLARSGNALHAGAHRQNLREQFGFPKESMVFITVGRLSREKDPELLLEAFRIVKKNHDCVRLVYVGDGSLRTRLEDLIREHSLEESVVLAGIHGPADVAAFLRGADVFVLSSVYEGMPISVLEALGCGLPVVSTDVGEVRRIVAPAVNGEIVSERDPKHLADAMLRCLSNAAAYQGEPCTNAVREFMPENVLQPIYDNYSELAKLPPSSRI
jgi:glycosyltransferase involved in cell wall biosynthesis